MFWRSEADMALEAAQRIFSHTVFCRERERETERKNLISHYGTWHSVTAKGPIWDKV